MATLATIGKGTTVKIKVGSTFTKVAECKDFSGIRSAAAAIVDATHLESTAKEKLVGIKDEGQVKFTFNYIPGDAGQAALEGARDTQALTDFQVLIGAMNRQFVFSAYVLTAELTVGVDKVTELSVTMEVSGSVVASTVTP